MALGIASVRVGNERVDLLPKLVLLPSRADSGPPQKPAEVSGHNESAHQTQRAEGAQDPAGVGRLWGSGLAAEGGGA
jgi:hypothetical protein